MLRGRAFPGTSSGTHLLQVLQEGASSGHVEDPGAAGEDGGPGPWEVEGGLRRPREQPC